MYFIQSVGHDLKSDAYSVPREMSEKPLVSQNPRSLVFQRSHVRLCGVGISATSNESLDFRQARRFLHWDPPKGVSILDFDNAHILFLPSQLPLRHLAGKGFVAAWTLGTHSDRALVILIGSRFCQLLDKSRSSPKFRN
eukprot:1330514-Amorphochlora_amoeboformis.AAC.3